MFSGIAYILIQIPTSALMWSSDETVKFRSTLKFSNIVFHYIEMTLSLKT